MGQGFIDTAASDLTPYRLNDADRAAIKQGLAEADRGELIDHEDVKERMAKWLGK